MVPVRRRKTDEAGNFRDSWQGYGEPLRDQQGEIIMCGTGVVAPDEWFKIKALIAERTDERWAKGKPAAKYLGTGSYRCGRMRDKKGTGELERCGGPMSHRGGRYRCEVRQTGRHPHGLDGDRPVRRGRPLADLVRLHRALRPDRRRRERPRTAARRLQLLHPGPQRAGGAQWPRRGWSPVPPAARRPRRKHRLPGPLRDLGSPIDRVGLPAR